MSTTCNLLLLFAFISCNWVPMLVLFDNFSMVGDWVSYVICHGFKFPLTLDQN
jgi:hypothetical protein